MKQYYLLLFAFTALCFTACNEDDSVDTQWTKDNQAAYNAVKSDTTGYWLPVTVPEGPEGVYYHALATGTDTVSPLQTSSVKVNYTGYLLNDKTQTFDAATNYTFTVSGVVRGFGVALQAMHVGDKWEICIPQHLGYGATAVSTTLKSYSTLFFEVELLTITLYPE